MASRCVNTRVCVCGCACARRRTHSPTWDGPPFCVIFSMADLASLELETDFRLTSVTGSSLEAGDVTFGCGLTVNRARQRGTYPYWTTPITGPVTPTLMA